METGYMIDAARRYREWVKLMEKQYGRMIYGGTK